MPQFADFTNPTINGEIKCELLSIPPSSFLNRSSLENKFSLELSDNGASSSLVHSLDSRPTIAELVVRETNPITDKADCRYAFRDIKVEKIRKGIEGRNNKFIQLDCNCQNFKLQDASSREIHLRGAEVVQTNDRISGSLLFRARKSTGIRGGKLVSDPQARDRKEIEADMVSIASMQKALAKSIEDLTAASAINQIENKIVDTFFFISAFLSISLEKIAIKKAVPAAIKSNSFRLSAIKNSEEFL